MNLDGLVLLVAVAVPVALVLRLLARPIDSRYVPTDSLGVEQEGDVPGLSETRRHTGVDEG